MRLRVEHGMTPRFFSIEIAIEELDRELYKLMSELVSPIVTAYLEEIDEAMVTDEAGRKETGIVIERRGVARSVQMRIGEVKFTRTHYKIKTSGEKVYGVFERMCLIILRKNTAAAKLLS
jgi:hypothetical protein